LIATSTTICFFKALVPYLIYFAKLRNPGHADQ
jgi:hypothetical protein